MSTADKIIIEEATRAVADHYARKMHERGIEPTEEALAAALAENWEQISGEIATLASRAKALLGA